MKTLALNCGLVLALAAGVASAETPEKVTVCAACHGADGKALQPIYPNLAGQYPNYLEHALHEYKSGKRKNPVMGAQAASLSDADIKALAEYFSQQQSPLYTPTVHGATK